MTIELRGGFTAEDPRLGRLPEFDERSRNYQIRELLDEQPSRRALNNRYWHPGPTLDQAREGQCVAEGCTDRHNGAPLRRRPMVLDYEMRRGYYHACQHRDPWHGCYLGPRCPIQPTSQGYGGTSTLAGMMEGRDRGWWSGFRWIGAGSGRLEDDIIDTLRGVGGILFGIPWLAGMYETQPDGLVRVEGPEVGGHLIHGFEWIPRLRLPKSFKGTKPAVAWHNSWGESYGVRRRRRSGVGYVLLDDLLPLVDNRRGEGAVPLP